MSAAPAQYARPLPEPDAGRRAHYGEFYSSQGLRADDRPYAVVHGNCQAESLRLVLEGPDLRTVRIPPAHELCPADLAHLARVVGGAAVVVSQPVRTGYRGLPVGTAELFAAAPAAARCAVVPVIRVAGLFPHHAIVRPPADPGLAPPLVAYHDLRLLAQAHARRTGAPAPSPRTVPAMVRRIAERSQRELRSREQRHGAVGVADLFDRPDFAQMRTLNHPGDPVWHALARRVRRALRLSDVPPARTGPLLDSVRAPREAVVLETFGLAGEPEDDWRVDGRVVGAEEVREAHLRWYASRPAVVAAGLERHGPALRDLGLLP